MNTDTRAREDTADNLEHMQVSKCPGQVGYCKKADTIDSKLQPA